MNEPGPALEYHALTVHEPGWPPRDDPRLVRGYHPMDPRRRPPPFKTYPGLVPIALPEPQLTAGLSAAGLSAVLFYSAGVVRVMDAGGSRIWFRAAGSAGNLHPLEVYLASGKTEGLDPGVYHYDPLEHALMRLRGAPADMAPALVVTGVPWRTGWKYTERGFRHLYWDAGTMLAQTLELAASAGLRARVELGFVDAEVAALVGADWINELPLAVVPLGEGEATMPGADDVPRGELADEPLEFPLITATQRTGDLETAGDVERWRKAAGEFRPRPASAEASWTLRGALEDVIRRRGSTRQFDPRRIALTELLTGAMAWATRPVPGDYGATLLEHNLIVHGVDGVEPGAYKWGPEGLELLRPGELREAAGRLCLGQELAADGSYTAFHCADLETVTEALGSRGYRAAQLEAGVVEGRLHLAAFSLGFGATGLTFFDDDVRRFFETDAWPMLVTAVGAPAYRSRPGGAPGRPVPLKR